MGAVINLSNSDAGSENGSKQLKVKISNTQLILRCKKVPALISSIHEITFSEAGSKLVQKTCIIFQKELKFHSHDQSRVIAVPVEVIQVNNLQLVRWNEQKPLSVNCLSKLSDILYGIF